MTLSKYPFMEYADEFMASMRGVYAEATWDSVYRRYRRQSKDLVRLKAEGKISSTSPKTMTVEDVRQFLAMRKNMDLSTTEMQKEIIYLRAIFDFCESKSLDACLRKYPLLIPHRKEARLPSIDETEYAKIFEASLTIDPDDWMFNRAYALVLLVGGVGMRTKEVRLCNVEDLDDVDWVLDIIRVKGEDSYGHARSVPIPPEIRPLLSNYLRLRGLWAEEMDLDSKALFPSSHSEDGYLVGNTLRNIKKIVVEDSGVEFDFRKLRRTFGQNLLDSGIKLDSVSVLMGHSTTNTTEKFYARRKNSQAVEDVQKMWGSERPKNRGSRK